eukprot:UN25535
MPAHFLNYALGSILIHVWIYAFNIPSMSEQITNNGILKSVKIVHIRLLSRKSKSQPI